jgi:hypothetical protein
VELNVGVLLCGEGEEFSLEVLESGRCVGGWERGGEVHAEGCGEALEFCHAGAGVGGRHLVGCFGLLGVQTGGKVVWVAEYSRMLSVFSWGEG